MENRTHTHYLAHSFIANESNTITEMLPFKPIPFLFNEMIAASAEGLSL